MLDCFIDFKMSGPGKIKFKDVIDFDWIKSASAQEYVDSLLHRNKRRQFGLLERPSLPPSKTLNMVKYKIFVCGKAGVGKSTLISRLAGCNILDTSSGSETVGITTTLIYWPVRLMSTGQIMFFQLHFWDVGENTIKKFDHVLPACRNDVDCIIFAFSVSDRASFTEVSTLLNQFDDSDKSPVQLITGTKTDQYAHSDISDQEIEALSKARNTPFVHVKCSVKSDASSRDYIFELSSFLNTICSMLFHRDYMLANQL